MFDKTEELNGEDKNAVYNAFSSKDPRFDGAFTLRLGYRPPYRFDLLLEFFRMRELDGVEKVGDDYYARTVRVQTESGEDVNGWLMLSDEPERNVLKVVLSESLLPATSQVAARLRRQFDLDCEPETVYEAISSLEKITPGAAVRGTRVPGCFDGFETCFRAVLGQQISVKAANKLAARVSETYGKPIDTPIDGLTRIFPSTGDIENMQPIEDKLGNLGVIKSRSHAISEIARLVESNKIVFNGEAPFAGQIQMLLDIKGIGPWTANYIAMRTMGHPDVFLETDAGIRHALPDTSPKERLEISKRWSPWRSYANICLWNSL